MPISLTAQSSLFMVRNAKRQGITVEEKKKKKGIKTEEYHSREGT